MINKIKQYIKRIFMSIKKYIDRLIFILNSHSEFITLLIVFPFLVWQSRLGWDFLYLNFDYLLIAIIVLFFSITLKFIRIIKINTWEFLDTLLLLIITCLLSFLIKNFFTIDQY